MSGQDFEVELPDGRRIVVEAADEKAAAAAANNFVMREGRSKQGKAGGVDNFVRSAAQGASFGFGDEIAAAGDATFGPYAEWALKKLNLGKTNTSQAKTWNERYTENLGGERAQDKAYADEHPGWDMAGKVTGGVGGAIATLPRALIAGGTGLVNGVGRSAATGAGLGAVTGFGEGEGGFDERMMGAGKGAVIGGAAGALLHPVAAGAGALMSGAVESGPGRAIADKVIGPGVRMMADALDSVAPKVKLKSLSAAAPDGHSVQADSFVGRAAETLRASAPTGENILDDAAARRIADEVKRGGDDVPGFKMRMDELGPGAMPADVNPMTQRLASTAYISPGGAPKVINKAMDARAMDTPDRVVGSVRKAMGDSDAAVLEAERLRGVRAGNGVADYAEAVGPDAPYVISPAMRKVMQEAPAVQKAMDTIMADAAENGVKLTPAQVAHRVKRHLALNADAAFMKGKATNKADVGDVAERWRSALHDANPAIKKADEVWQHNTNVMESLDLGRQFMKQGTGEVADAVSGPVLAKRIPTMSAEEAQAFIAGAADTLVTKANNGPRQARAVMSDVADNKNLRSKLSAMIGEENTAILFNRAMSERTFAGTDRVVRGGSDTGRKLLSALDDAASGDLPTTPHSMVNRILGGLANAYNKQKAGNEAVRERIAKMLTETDAGANEDLLNKIAAQLSKANKPRGIQRGTAAGVAGQE